MHNLVSILLGYYSLKVKVFPINVKHTLLQLVVRGVNLKIVGFLWPQQVQCGNMNLVSFVKDPGKSARSTTQLGLQTNKIETVF